MPRRRYTVRQRRLALAPLVDVIFLLLLFFMLTSTFTRFGEIELDVASAGGGAPAADRPVFLRLGEAGLTLNGRPVELDDLAASVERFRGATPVRLLLSVAPGARAQGLADAVVALRAVPDSSLAVVR